MTSAQGGDTQGDTAKQPTSEVSPPAGSAWPRRAAEHAVQGDTEGDISNDGATTVGERGIRGAGQAEDLNRAEVVTVALA